MAKKFPTRIILRVEYVATALDSMQQVAPPTNEIDYHNC